MIIQKDMFKLGINKQLNNQYTIDIIELKIVSGCVYWYFNTLEDLIKAIEELKCEIEGK